MPPLDLSQETDIFRNVPVMDVSLIEAPKPEPTKSDTTSDFFDDEYYEEPDFTPPAYTLENLGLSTGQIKIELLGRTIIDRVGLQLVIVGSQQIQQNGAPEAEKDGWFELTEASDTDNANIIFTANHHTFADRYRAGYSYYLERIYEQTRNYRGSTNWQIDQSNEANHVRVISMGIDTLPCGLYRKRTFGQDGFMHTPDGKGRPRVSEFVDDLESKEVDHVVARRPLGGSFVLINEQITPENPDSAKTARILQFPTLDEKSERKLKMTAGGL